MSISADTYQVLRQRLRDASDDLRSRFVQLNAERASVFGNLDTKLVTTFHVTTDHNCVPRDLYSFGDRLLLGYNVQFGLKNEVAPSDVFSLYRIDQEAAHQESLDGLLSDSFRKDFSDLYRYYRSTFFSRFAVAGPFLYMVFQVGKTPSDIKAFKWAIEGGALRYVDNRSDQEVRYPEQHAFRWQRATREHHRFGKHPHISIQDLVFVECVGGDLTIKVEDNTESGAGIYSEPVENADQTLDDAEIYYCVLGNLVLLKMRPYQEKDFRHIVFSVKRREATRLDAMQHACVQLPDDHGIILPNGVFLQTGTYKIFDHGLNTLHYQRTLAAPNGEDFLYQFFEPVTGTYLHLRYNLIRQEVETPLTCHGQTFLEDGTMIAMRAQDSPQKHHALQVWQTPFVGPNFQVPVTKDSMLYKIGNRDLVRAMAESQEVLQLIDKDESYADLYADLVKRTTDILDSYFWLDREETFRLSEPLAKIRQAAAAAVDEYEKVVRVRRETESKFLESRNRANDTMKGIERSRFESIDEFVKLLSDLREQRGIAIGLRELRYIDLNAVSALEKELSEASEKLGQRCVQFLLQASSFDPYHRRIAEVAGEVEKASTAAFGRELDQQLGKIGTDLELLTETVSQIKIEDLTQRTAIVDRTGELLAELNRIRSGLRQRMRDLLSGEMEADFASQVKLLDQSASGALDTTQTPEQVDDALTRTMLQIEELEGRFAEFDSLLTKLTEKRESIYAAFEAKREQLVEARARRSESLAAAAIRILQGIESRTARIDTPEALRSYFASDPMVDKVRRIAEQLKELGDSVRMEDILGKLKTIADDSIRQQRDRRELFVDGQDSIRLGRHLFSVNRQPIELTTVVREEKLQLHVTGTQFFEPIRDEAIERAKDLWGQYLPSENQEVYRAEFLADDLFRKLQNDKEYQGMTRSAYRALSLEARVDWIRRVMQTRHAEGYARGVHDADSRAILDFLFEKQEELGLLVYPPSVRATTWYIWKMMVPDESRLAIEQWIAGFQVVAGLMKNAKASMQLLLKIEELLVKYESSAMGAYPRRQGAKYLLEQLLVDPVHPIRSPKAIKLLENFLDHCNEVERSKLQGALDSLHGNPSARWILALDTADAFIRQSRTAGEDQESPESYRQELGLLLLSNHGERLPTGSDSKSPSSLLESMRGDFPRIAQGKLPIHFHDVQSRLQRYRRNVLPRYHELQTAKHRFLSAAEQKLRTSEFKARVLTSFVRNRLIDEVFLPRIGDNLAKQLGAAGDAKRSDRMGLLLLISPPGYGKTTLMEYVANRLGLVFVKINGPALGHAVTSLDPAEAGNAASREEVQRINLALEMGDNVMLYIDDIQHCHPEFLQKFIPLCDATRRVEGVWQEQAKTYDLRGRKFAVVMAGNPYTESGQRFQIPDMLANRADIYNLGEIIGGAREAFELSYLENCLTSNAVLQPLSRASAADQQAVIQAAIRGSLEGIQLEQNLSNDALQEMFAVLTKLVQVRDIVLKVNREYIKSAAQADAYRVEPPFKLQGSYRNMNRIAEKIAPVMNQEELMTTMISSYEQDAQTLTRDGESNLLKFRELLGIQNEADRQRWEQICYAYVENVRMSSIQGNDQVAQVLKTMVGLRDGLESIRRVIGEVATIQQKETVVETAPPPSSVIVKHAVPRVMTDLLRSQFQLIHDGLRPILELSTHQSATMDRLRRSLDQCLLDYQAMQKVVDSSQEEASTERGELPKNAQPRPDEETPS